jgi:hypothetical protein
MMSDDTPMLPLFLWQGAKPKLPKAFAWVMGVERLSKRFADVPQFNNLKIWFSDEPRHHQHGRPTAMTMTYIVAEKIPYQVFTVWYSLNLPEWFFMVYPVEALKRQFVRSLLEEQTFPIVEQWMKKEHTPVWLQRGCHLRCIWDPGTESIAVQEAIG